MLEISSRRAESICAPYIFRQDYICAPYILRSERGCFADNFVFLRTILWPYVQTLLFWTAYISLKNRNSKTASYKKIYKTVLLPIFPPPILDVFFPTMAKPEGGGTHPRASWSTFSATSWAVVLEFTKSYRRDIASFLTKMMFFSRNIFDIDKIWSHNFMSYRIFEVLVVDWKRRQRACRCVKNSSKTAHRSRDTEQWTL